MKRAKKILLWTGISLGTLIAILLICAACYSWILGSRLEKRLAAIKAAGDPICLADLARKPMPPEQNAATYLRRAKDDLAAIGQIDDLSDNEGNYKPEDMKKIEDILKAYPNLYPLLEKAAACPDFDSQMDFTLPPDKLIGKILEDMSDITMFRASARYLRTRAKVLIIQGDRDEALRMAILIFQLSRHREREPLLINYLFSRAIEGISLECANEILQAGPVSDQVRAALAAELSLHGSMDKCRTTIKSERAFSLDHFRYKLPHPWILSNKWQLAVLDVFDEYLNYSLQPYSGWADKHIQHVPSKSPFDVFAELMRPVFQQMLVATYRTQAQSRALCIINALQWKMPPDSGKIPTMAELGLPDEVGIDPFNGKPMIIKKLPQGWLVYSVGENLKDDGGKVVEESGNKPQDIGFSPKIPTPQSQGKELSQ
jgi:hypothetical protein